MPYYSAFFGVDVRDEIVREFTDHKGHVDDMLAGLHEIRARLIASRLPSPGDREAGGAAPEASRTS